MTPIIAIDGLTAAGKGTLSKRLAQHLHFAHLDTGLLYRATAYKTLEQNVNPIEAAQNLVPADLADESRLRNDRVATRASEVAAVPEVRSALFDFQRNFPEKSAKSGTKGTILDGRDIGTVIFPNADAKLFVTASAEIRAERRFQELFNKGQAVTRAQVLADLQQRDARDQNRDDAPTIAAPDALVLDTSEMDPDQAFDTALAFIKKRITA